MDNILAPILAHEWAVFLIIATLLLVSAEAGFRLGSRLYVAGDAGRKGQIGGIQAAVLGLLGLLLGFTFAMAVDRHDTRRGLIVKEASTIRTTYLRASLLPDAHQAPVRDLLRRYLDLRLKYQALAEDPAQLAEGMRMSSDIEAELWIHATEAAKEAPNDITATFIESVNETVDLDAGRLAAMRAKIPGGVWLLLLMVAAFGCLITGYSAGADGARTTLGALFMPLLITVVIVLIFDISHPRAGLIGISEQPLVDLQNSIQRINR